MNFNSLLVIAAIVAALLIGAAVYLSKKSPNTKSPTGQNEGKNLIGYTSTTTSSMKLFYFIVFSWVLVSVFCRVWVEADAQWGGFSAVPDTDSDKTHFSWLFSTFVVLEALHFFRMYAYLHCLEEPLSLVHSKFIRPIQKKAHARWLLFTENITRLILVSLVSLKFLENILTQVDAFRLFAGYLLFFYFFLIAWDVIIAYAAGLSLLIETYFIDNFLAISCLIWFKSGLPRSVPMVQDDVQKVILGEGGYTGTLVCLILLCIIVFLSLIVRPLVRILQLHAKLQKQHGNISLKILVGPELTMFKEIGNEMWSLFNPQYGKKLSRCTMPMFREGDYGPRPELCNGDKCLYEKVAFPLFVEGDRTISQKVTKVD